MPESLQKLNNLFYHILPVSSRPQHKEIRKSISPPCSSFIAYLAVFGYTVTMVIGTYITRGGQVLIRDKGANVLILR